MVRPSQRIHPAHTPAAPRPAATLLLLRDSPGGPEVLMTRRSTTARFSPGAYVFPGGVVDPEDTSLADTAIRECFEELGVLLTHGPAVTFDRQAPFHTQCAQHGLAPAVDALHPLAHWITDRDLPLRFDVMFFAARMPQGQTPVADQTEQFEPVWVRPADALARHNAGDFAMVFPTIRTLERLQTYADVQSLLSACSSGQPLWASCPRAGWQAGVEARFMEHETPYGELALVCPDGQLLHRLDWQTEHPVALLKNVQRLTAPNPGFMTGPGTNSYLVGDADTGYIAIDPGPNDPAHLQRLWQAAGGDIRQIVCTHSHPDHSPGARPLQALVIQSGRATPPILGLPSASTARPDSQFTPDRALQNEELLILKGQTSKHSLMVIHTPGHAANHLCLVLLEDGLLFSGDHVLNGSTTVVAPPDGHMTAYLDSLDRLAAACSTHGIEFILPAHGYVLGQAHKAIAQLKAHRLQREAKVWAAMQALPNASPREWVAKVYSDVPERMWPVAERSLMAHVERLRELHAWPT